MTQLFINRHLLSALLLLITLCFALPSVAAEEKQLVLFYSSTENEKLADRLSDQLPQLSDFKNIRKVDINDYTIAQLEKILTPAKDCAITLGELSLKTLLSTRPNNRVFSLLVAKHQLDTFIENYSRFGVELSGIYQEQSFKRQLMLVQSIQPSAKKVALALGLKTKYWLNYYRNLSQQHNFELDYNLLNLQSSLQLFVEQLEANKTFLMVINDRDVYSPLQLQAILVTSYNRQIPIIGSKLSDSKHAAMVSVYSPTELLFTEVSQNISQFCRQQQLAPPSFARNFSISINPSIARSLNYTQLDEKAIKRKIQLLESNNKEAE